MIDLALLALIVTAAAAGGLAGLRVAGARPTPAGDALLAGTAVGLGLAAAAALGLAAAGVLSAWALALLGGLALAGGGRDLVRTLRALDRRGLGAVAPWLAVSALVVAAALVPVLAPPVGGDQTKYHLVYPRLYAEAGSLVATPWSFWGQMQFLPNFLFAVGFALSGDVLARLLNVTLGVLAALALGALVSRHLARRAGAMAATLFLTLPITWSLMTRAGADLAVVLYGALATSALLDWLAAGRDADLRRAGLVAGLAGASKTMGLLVPALICASVLAASVAGAVPARRVAQSVAACVFLVLVAASPYYVRNAVETGNPIHPFGHAVFEGRPWSVAASDYLADYYRKYRTTHATRREGEPYVGLAVARFPWDMTMHPQSFENAARAGLDISPFVLAFAPALALVRRRAVLLTAGFGLAYVAIIAGAAWAHPRYVVPGIALLLAATIPAARELVARRTFVALVALTILGNLALTTRLLVPLWPDQGRVVLGWLAPEDFLRRHSARFAFWERANAAVPPEGKVLVLEKIPHPYYIERPYVLGSYLEQGLIDYRQTTTPEALADVARELGVTHVAVDLDGLEAQGDPYEATVGRLWRGFVATECDPLVRQGGYGLYALREPSALACAGERVHG